MEAFMLYAKNPRAVVAGLFLLIAFALGACALFAPARRPPSLAIAELRDGVYIGERRSIPITASVEVTVRAGRILSIRVLKHFSHPDHSATALADRVVAAQSLEVDGISGATKSSRILLDAIRRALQKGLSTLPGP
jgi:uncharacterized protein with FMN-binding domain